MYDTAVIGGGPAGLTAALYLARYHLSVCLIDSGASRAALIPKTHNQPSWPDGISGVALLKHMRQHAAQYPVRFEHGVVSEIRRCPGGFEVRSGDGTIAAETVLLATGVDSHRPSMSADDHDRALARGLLRYCPICDGFEITDQNVAVVGHGERLFGEAKFLRSYTSAVTVFSENGPVGLEAEQRDEFASIGIQIVDAPALGYKLAESAIEVFFSDACMAFDTMYAALGSITRSGIVSGTGARMTEEGCLMVDAHQRTSVAGMYAAGDVVVGVDQITYAMGQATVAATSIRNDLSDRRGLLRNVSPNHSHPRKSAQI
jgi:thioredoxin reductase (NADPH)